jgi:tryptophan 2,3-dioxygenase
MRDTSTMDVIPSDDGSALDEILAAQARTAGPTYSDFLRLDELLALQPGFDGNSDSLLFFVIHQTKELWMRVMEVETVTTRDRLFAGDIHEALKAIARVRSIQQVMIESWSALSTLTPVDYLSFRDQLGTSSGFQSPGYRKLEFVLGQKDARYLEPHIGTSHHRELRAVLDAPSLYDAALHYLDRIGVGIPADRLERDWSQPYEPSPGVLAAWRTVYTEHHAYSQAYRLGETLVDVEYDFQIWRFKHYKTVERIIGSKPGTGGSSGVGYLKLAFDRYFYPELWAVRNEL